MSISLDAELGDQVRKAAKRSGVGLSSWIARAVESRLRAEALDEFLDWWESEHGPITPDELRRAEERLGLFPARESP